MDIETITAFFMWCTIINVGIIAFSFVILAGARGWVYKMHSKCFPIPQDTFNAAIYSFLGLYKILIIIFNLIPYLALSIIK